MYRHQVILLVLIGTLVALPARGAGPSSQAAGWRPAASETGEAMFTGKLAHNAADENGIAPYVVSDRYGVVQGYVTPAAGVELEPFLGQQVSLRGNRKNLPGGDMPLLTAEEILVQGRRVSARQAAAPVRQFASAPQQTEAYAPQWTSPARQASAPARQFASANVPQPHRAAPVHAASYEEVIRTPQGQPATAPTQVRRDPPTDPPQTFQGPIAEGEAEVVPGAGPIVDDEGPVVHPNAGCDSCDSGDSCESCGPRRGNACNSFCQPHPKLFNLGPTGLWIDADYLLWSMRGEHVPALVSTAPAGESGRLNNPNATVLFGDSTINDVVRSGGRIKAGFYLDQCETIGVEGEYLRIGDESTHYRQWSDGNPSLFRPFYNTALDANRQIVGEDAEIVAFPNVLAGAVSVDALTQFGSAGVRFLFTTCKKENCWDDPQYCGINYHDTYRSQLILGYRNMRLDDSLSITEELVATLPNPLDAGFGSKFLINDSFHTTNEFSGGEIGMQYDMSRNCWSLCVIPKVALGNTHQTVDITGFTRATNAANVRTLSAGGLLAQPTNIGSYTKDEFSVVPELDATIGYQVTPHAKLTVGYSFIYWNNVARATEQIDRSVNGSQTPQAIAAGVPVTGDTTHPKFSFNESGFWAQGVNFGLDLRW